MSFRMLANAALVEGCTKMSLTDKSYQNRFTLIIIYKRLAKTIQPHIIKLATSELMKLIKAYHTETTTISWDTSFAKLEMQTRLVFNHNKCSCMHH